MRRKTKKADERVASVRLFYCINVLIGLPVSVMVSATLRSAMVSAALRPSVVSAAKAALLTAAAPFARVTIFPVARPLPTAVMAPRIGEINPKAFTPDSVVDFFPVTAGLNHDCCGLRIDDGCGLRIDNRRGLRVDGRGLCVDDGRGLRIDDGRGLRIDHGLWCYEYSA